MWIRLMLIVGSNGSLCYDLTALLHNTLILLAGNSEYFIMNSGHIVEFLKSINLLPLDNFVSFDAASSSTNVAIEEAL
jgi:hypothetical protein